MADLIKVYIGLKSGKELSFICENAILKTNSNNQIVRMQFKGFVDKQVRYIQMSEIEYLYIEHDFYYEGDYKEVDVNE